MLSINQNRFLAGFVALFLAFSVNAANASGHEGGGEKKPEGPIFVDFKNIVVPVIKKDGKSGVVALAMMAEVKDAEGQAQVTNNLPKLRDAFIRALYGNLESDKYKRENGSLDIDFIKDRLLKTAAYVMNGDKENPIKDILFQNIALQSY